MNKIDKFSLTEVAIQEACQSWETGGTQGLSHWLTRYKPKFTVQDYSELVRLVRLELDDQTDYSHD
jgi:hypothetical protein